ncbi:MAG: hypothetical protein LLF76_02390 [Planctomycetaceae bacterium]|nr:hypothetical protein [Planctomycetaceae bacterium]
MSIVVIVDARSECVTHAEAYADSDVEGLQVCVVRNRHDMAAANERIRNQLGMKAIAISGNSIENL